jgi:hypothetical protein
LAIHRQSIDDYIPDPQGKGNAYVPKPADWKAPTPEEIAAQRAAAYAAKKAASLAAAGSNEDGTGNPEVDGVEKEKKKKHKKPKITSTAEGGEAAAGSNDEANADGDGSADDEGDDDDDDSDLNNEQTNELSDGGDSANKLFDKRKFNRGRAHRRSYRSAILSSVIVSCPQARSRRFHSILVLLYTVSVCI